jgi:Protein of unknown function (DUF3108)
MALVRRVGLALAAVVAAACSGSSGGSALPLNTRIGPDGGSFLIGNAGDLQLDVPPGALAEPVTMTLTSTPVSSVVGFVDVGPGFRFEPASLVFAQQAQLRIPYSPSRVSDVVDPAELRIARRDASGAVEVLVPLVNDGLYLTAFITELGSYWAIAPDVVSGGTLLPLGNNDTYTFDSGLRIDVTRPATGGNVPGGSVRVAFTQGGATSGWYLADTGEQITKLGEFDGTDWQEIQSPASLLIDTRDSVGAVHPTYATYEGHEPFGAPAVAYQGILETTTSILGRETLQTVRGVFRTVRVQIRSRYSNTRSQTGDETMDLWLADRVGPVAIRLPGQANMALITSGTVGGRAVTGGGI